MALTDDVEVASLRIMSESAVAEGSATAVAAAAITPRLSTVLLPAPALIPAAKASTLASEVAFGEPAKTFESVVPLAWAWASA